MPCGRRCRRFQTAIAENGDALAPDFQFHLEVARATQNVHFLDLMNYLGTMIIRVPA